MRQAQATAYAPGEFVEQESFMRASEIRALARQAGIGPGVSVLDLCCGVGGPGRFITRELGCTYLGVDASSSAIEIARERAGDLPCRFEVARVPPLPPGPFDVVLLLETMLAFPDKDALLREISAALATGGRFACTLEEGAPLTHGRARAHARRRHGLAHPARRDGCSAGARRAGVTWQEDHSRAHGATARALADAYAAQTGRPALDDLLAAHRLWIEWLETGRVRKFALVAQRE